MPRLPQGILVSCPIPWNEHHELAQDLFTRLVRQCIDDGYRNLYIFGTGGEGYAVDRKQFSQIAKLFLESTRDAGVEAMVGVIGLSVPTILERLGLAHDIGFRLFQISLPSWGSLNDREVRAFFTSVCSAFPDSRFLHYNLPRAKRVLGGNDYKRLIAEVPNLSATKTTSGGLPLAADLLRNAPELQHFLGESNFPHGAMYGECSLLASYAQFSPQRTKALFEAGRTQNVAELFRLQHELQTFSDALWGAVSGPHMDGAFDKMLVKLGPFPEFPLRLLPPYESFTEGDYTRLRRLVDSNFPTWRR